MVYSNSKIVTIATIPWTTAGAINLITMYSFTVTLHNFIIGLDYQSDYSLALFPHTCSVVAVSVA